MTYVRIKILLLLIYLNESLNERTFLIIVNLSIYYIFFQQAQQVQEHNIYNTTIDLTSRVEKVIQNTINMLQLAQINHQTVQKIEAKFNRYGLHPLPEGIILPQLIQQTHNIVQLEHLPACVNGELVWKIDKFMQAYADRGRKSLESPIFYSGSNCHQGSTPFYII